MRAGEHSTRRVPPEVVAWVECILATRNVDGKVPLDIAERILDDMAVIAERTADWSCESLRKYGLHTVNHDCPDLKESA